MKSSLSVLSLARVAGAQLQGPWVSVCLWTLCLLGSSDALGATSLSIKNGAAPANVSASLNVSCAAASSSDDHVVKWANDQRIRALSSLSSAQKSSFFAAVSEATGTAPTSRQASVTFDLLGEQTLGLAEEALTPDGGLFFQWGSCLHVRVFDGSGLQRQVTFFSDPGSVAEGAPCYQGLESAHQTYRWLLEAELEGMSVLNREYGGMQMITDSLSLGWVPTAIASTPLPVDGSFFVPLSFVESIELEDNHQDLDGDGYPNNLMGFLFADLLAAGSTQVGNFTLEIVLPALIEAHCQTRPGETDPNLIWTELSGSGEQGALSYDTERAYLNWN